VDDQPTSPGLTRRRSSRTDSRPPTPVAVAAGISMGLRLWPALSLIQTAMRARTGHHDRIRPSRRSHWLYHRLSLCLFVLAFAACDSDEEEGPCFAPGEPCGAGHCSQAAFCGTDQLCVAKRVDGSECTEARQCLGGRCEQNVCAGGKLVCKDD